VGSEGVGNEDRGSTRYRLMYFRGSALLEDERYSRGIRQELIKLFGRSNSGDYSSSDTHRGSSTSSGTNITTTSSADDILVSCERVDLEQHYAQMRETLFCIAPPGWQLWSLHLFEAIASGCIPILVSNGHNYGSKYNGYIDDDGAGGDLQLPFVEVVDYSKFALRVRCADLPLLPVLLRQLVKEHQRTTRANADAKNKRKRGTVDRRQGGAKIQRTYSTIQRLQEGLARVWIHFTYQTYPHPQDAFALSMQELTKLHLRQRKWKMPRANCTGYSRGQCCSEVSGCGGSCRDDTRAARAVRLRHAPQWLQDAVGAAH
jgi:hypothetical protein